MAQTGPYCAALLLYEPNLCASFNSLDGKECKICDSFCRWANMGAKMAQLASKFPSFGKA
jgi:hypothetical protein